MNLKVFYKICPWSGSHKTQHHDTQHKNKLNATLSKTSLSITLLDTGLAMLSVANNPSMLECRNLECRRGDCDGALMFIILHSFKVY